MALQTARLPTVKTLSGYDFSFQPSLDRNRVLALAAAGASSSAHQCVHLLGPPGTGKSHLAIALGRGSGARRQERVHGHAGRAGGLACAAPSARGACASGCAS